jgi:hypothetical protein
MTIPRYPTGRGTLVQSLPSWTKLWPYCIEIPADLDSRQLRDERYQWLEANISPAHDDFWEILVGSRPVGNGKRSMIYLFKVQEHAVRFTLTWL